ncbi:hypothetical protein ACJIZ3_023867 [Penstemon smallii]|uniref:Uncharacterized protein n=1 Tax=Penstemon smallii TaxID=265156 RepID=A0ABD3TRQ2_9LAMI
MDSYHGTHQWYQSSRSSIVLQKNEKAIEIETENYLSRHYNQPRRNSGIYGTDLKNFSKQTGGNKEEKSMEILREPSNIHDSIDQKMIETRRMIADMNSKQSNHFDFSSKSVSHQQRIFDLGSQQLFSTKSVQNYQVSSQSGNSNSYKKYNIYSAVELDDPRDRGLCIWCDEFWYIDMIVNENDPIELRVDVTFVDEEVSHCETKLIEDCVENESNVWSKIMCEDGNENWESSEALGKNCILEKNELQVFEKMCEKNTLENIAEKGVVYAIGSENEKLRTLELYDEGSGNLLDTVVADQLLKRIGALFSRLSILEGFNQSWIAWPELPVPPPEPPPRML